MTIDIGAPAPDFTLKNQHGEEVTLSSFRGERNVVLVFFPFAFSGTCTGELCEIRDNIGDFASQDADVLVRLDADADTLVRARVPGHRCPAVGARVALVVDGAVMAYAR